MGGPNFLAEAPRGIHADGRGDVTCLREKLVPPSIGLSLHGGKATRRPIVLD